LQLVKSPRLEVAARLRSMPESLLAQLATELEASMEEDWSGERDTEANSTQEGGVGSARPPCVRRGSDDVGAKAAQVSGENSSSSGNDSSSDEEEAERRSLAICDEALGADSDADCEESRHHEAHMEATPAQPTVKSQVSRVRGVFKTLHKGYMAAIGVEYLEIGSYGLRTLDDAIDIHISLVQLKQLVLGSLGDGIGFRSALTQAMHTMQSQRRASGFSRAGVYFNLRCLWMDGKNTWQTKDMEKAIALWEVHASPRSKLKRDTGRERLEKRRKAQEDKSRRKVEAEQRRARTQRVRPRLQLRALISSALQKKDPLWQKWLRQTWKVSELPDGVRFATLRFENDCVCSVLTLQDGSERHGPLRKSIREAEKDLADLRALQRSTGDTATCAELEARDVQAMTAFFASRLDQRSRR